MLDLIQFILELFTSPVEAIGTIVILGLTIAGIRWFAARSKSNLPLDTAPEVILRHLLKFGDEDLEQNRAAAISPGQIKRIRKEFLIILAVYITMIVGFGFFMVALFWDDISSGRLDPIMIGFLGFMVLIFLFITGIAVYHLRGHIRELRTKRALALLSLLVFEEHEGEHMGFKFKTHQYKIIASDPRLPKPLPLHIGFMSEDVWYQVQKLRHQTALLYIAPNTLKLLSFEILATKSAVSLEDVK